MNTLLLTLALSAAPEPTTIYVNGKVWTGDPAKPEVEAFAVRGGKIIYVGAANAAPEGTRVNLGGRRVVPGFIDSHAHFLSGGRSLMQVDLKNAKDEAAFGKLLREWDAKMPTGRWLIGGNWDHDRTFAGALPTAAIIDKYVKDRPVFINRYDGHMAVANSAAMKIAGITKDTKEIPGGVIYRNGAEPTGLLKDNAMGLVDRHVPEPDAKEIAEAVAQAMQACAAVGITSVSDMDGSSRETSAKYYDVLERLGDQLTVRVDRHLPIATVTGSPSRVSERLATTGVKGFMDGSLGSSTARMEEPYVNDPRTRGVFVTEPRVMANHIAKANGSKFIVSVHAIGDRANAELLEIYQSEAPRARFRIEHAQHLRPMDYPRFKLHNVVASMQPYHVIDDGRWAEGRIGAKRCESSYAYRSLLDAGATLAFGSDWPVAPLNVLAGIDAAVNRRTLDGKHPDGWFPAQRISVEEALRAYTVGSAYAGMHERERGKIKDGYVADFVVLSRDILDPKERDSIAKTDVLKTVMSGDVVYEKK